MASNSYLVLFYLGNHHETSTMEPEQLNSDFIAETNTSHAAHSSQLQTCFFHGCHIKHFASASLATSHREQGHCFDSKCPSRNAEWSWQNPILRQVPIAAMDVWFYQFYQKDGMPLEIMGQMIFVQLRWNDVTHQTSIFGSFWPIKISMKILQIKTKKTYVSGFCLESRGFSVLTSEVSNLQCHHVGGLGTPKWDACKHDQSNVSWIWETKITTLPGNMTGSRWWENSYGCQ